MAAVPSSELMCHVQLPGGILEDGEILESGNQDVSALITFNLKDAVRPMTASAITSRSQQLIGLPPPYAGAAAPLGVATRMWHRDQDGQEIVRVAAANKDWKDIYVLGPGGRPNILMLPWYVATSPAAMALAAAITAPMYELNLNLRASEESAHPDGWDATAYRHDGVPVTKPGDPDPDVHLRCGATTLLLGKAMPGQALELGLFRAMVAAAANGHLPDQAIIDVARRLFVNEDHLKIKWVERLDTANQLKLRSTVPKLFKHWPKHLDQGQQPAEEQQQAQQGNSSRPQRLAAEKARGAITQQAADAAAEEEEEEEGDGGSAGSRAGVKDGGSADSSKASKKLQQPAHRRPRGQQHCSSTPLGQGGEFGEEATVPCRYALAAVLAAMKQHHGPAWEHGAGLAVDPADAAAALAAVAGVQEAVAGLQKLWADTAAATSAAAAMNELATVLIQLDETLVE